MFFGVWTINVCTGNKKVSQPIEGNFIKSILTELLCTQSICNVRKYQKYVEKEIMHFGR